MRSGCCSWVTVAVLALQFIPSDSAAAQTRPLPLRTAMGSFGDVQSLLEAEGDRSPRDSTVLPGDVARRCADVGSGPARSGEFTVRGFDDYAWIWYAGGSKLIWWPTHSAPADTLAVRVINARRFEDSVSFRFGKAVRPFASTARMFPSGPRLPRSGPWFIVGRAGRSWGCFFYVLPDTAVYMPAGRGRN